MESLLEQQRRYHEERERLTDALVQERLMTKAGHKETINSEHRQRHMLERYDDTTNKLREIYEDKDGERKKEVQALSGPNEFTEFYNRLKQIKEFHRRHPGEISVPMSVEFEELKKIRENPADDLAMVPFSDEEGYGKYLDLHECYDKFINLKGVERMDYIQYIKNFDALADIPKERKNADYKNYLSILSDYLYSFLNRTKPLLRLDDELLDASADIDGKLERGELPGWAKEQQGAMAHTGAHLDLSAFSTPEELSSLGLDRLKSGLLALGLKCGGTLQERAERLFMTKGRDVTELPAAIFSKQKPGNKAGRPDNSKHREIACLECQIYRMAELIGEVRNDTVENVERKQARTEGEREESEGEISEEEEDPDDDDDIPYNPKNLPLGWDGKPIPYWLYKLHGLNISYNCEICGNQTYKGPKAFQRHFAEWRHAHGMRCLGIPNTAHFANVTQIEDAMALWEKLKVQKQEEAWKPEMEEEFEDSKGNVVNKKTYEDLKRQGLL
ncbi:splicing factor 3A subunit 3 [Eurytemora carolleeae]|uniref:splicing factor 3A subunit 3 n=1 Tax=Eurytemora carolleeae TaxID=1294199 RepID=UPI000C77AE29|nr:splicing factor 3A subunit 3 [Eurytemora carolleeae]|eukprot:XP_023330503.1 splicing factor 3A subunit 3-like [Eurytemora affinis]